MGEYLIGRIVPFDPFGCAPFDKLRAGRAGLICSGFKKVKTRGKWVRFLSVIAIKMRGGRTGSRGILKP